jgi:hypothetical protein
MTTANSIDAFFSRALRSKTLGVLVGVPIGAAGWIVGAAWNLDKGGRFVDSVLVWICALGVLRVGLVFWLVWMTGRRLSIFVVVQVLLGASALFGSVALYIVRERGLVGFAVDPSGRYPEALAYAAPLCILVFMATVYWPPIRRRVVGTQTYLQRRGAADRSQN